MAKVALFCERSLKLLLGCFRAFRSESVFSFITQFEMKVKMKMKMKVKMKVMKGSHRVSPFIHLRPTFFSWFCGLQFVGDWPKSSLSGWVDHVGVDMCGLFGGKNKNVDGFCTREKCPPSLGIVIFRSQGEDTIPPPQIWIWVWCCSLLWLTCFG